MTNIIAFKPRQAPSTTVEPGWADLAKDGAVLARLNLLLAGPDHPATQGDNKHTSRISTLSQTENGTTRLAG